MYLLNLGVKGLININQAPFRSSVVQFPTHQPCFPQLVFSRQIIHDALLIIVL